ncbi:MAG: heme biosynthesis HemY N-terminal domain-containing protein, partial [Hyphomicrobiaceae bacterium]
MLRLVLLLVGIFGLSAALAWLADRPGSINIEWQGYTANPSVFQAVIAVAALLALTLLAWSIIRQLWQSPANIGSFFMKRRNKRGLDSLSSGMIAIGAGDRALATRYAIQARKALPNEPLTHLLRAQAAQLSGDRTTARRIFDAMLASPDTE